MSNTLSSSQGTLAAAQARLGSHLTPDGHRILQGLYELSEAIKELTAVTGGTANGQSLIWDDQPVVIEDDNF